MGVMERPTKFTKNRTHEKPGTPVEPQDAPEREASCRAGVAAPGRDRGPSS